MDLKTEITGVERVEVDGATAALIRCDMQAALERCYFAYNDSNEDTDTTVNLHPEFGSARIEWIADEPAGLRCGPWVIYVSSTYEGVVVFKNEGYWDDDVVNIDMENEWIDVLVIVRNFFALDRAESWNWEKFL